MSKLHEQSFEAAKIAFHALEDKQGIDIKVLDISGLSVLADYFVIASAGNTSQINALSDNVEEQLAKAGYRLKSKEGRHMGGWILLDFTDIIVHVLGKNEREFYNLERVWADASPVTIK